MSNDQNKLKTIITALEKGNLKKAVSLCLKLINLNDQAHLDLQTLSSRISKVEYHFNLEMISNKEYWQKLKQYSIELAAIVNDLKANLTFSLINNTRTIGLPNKNFVGRDDLIDRLFESFQKGERIQVLHGMSGIGKMKIKNARN